MVFATSFSTLTRMDKPVETVHSSRTAEKLNEAEIFEYLNNPPLEEI